MKAEPKISRDLENGYLFVDGERIFAFRIKTFQAFMDRLNVLAGKPVSQVLSDQMGKAIGHTAMDYSKDHVHSVEDLWKVADELLSQRGCGRCMGGEKRAENGTNRFIFRLKGIPTSYERKATEPTCHVMRGVVQGWIEGYLGRNAVSSSEIRCVSTGSSECVFEVKFTSD
jgi:predicted hydrocarbon binding protein